MRDVRLTRYQFCGVWRASVSCFHEFFLTGSCVRAAARLCAGLFAVVLAGRGRSGWAVAGPAEARAATVTLTTASVRGTLVFLVNARMGQTFRTGTIGEDRRSP